jgi:hypothetical protein
MIRRGIGIQSYVAAGGGAAPYVGLLDTYTGAAAAYSLRLLRTAYTGSAIRVRRSSDNTEQDIGFDISGNLNQSALTTFVGANNGFVTTWYDQSGNVRNVTQTTAANQPQIVSSGSVIVENGKPSIQWDLTDSLRSATNLALSNTNYTSFHVVKQTTNIENSGIIGLTPSTGNDFEQINSLIETCSNNVKLYDMINIIANVELSQSGTGATPYGLRSAIKTPTFAEIFVNNNSISNVTKTISSGTSNSILLGQRFLSSAVQTTYGLSGIMQEVILYLQNESSNRAAISTNINSFYSIY